MSSEPRLPFEEVAPPGPWRGRGACAAVPTEVFFPGRGASLEAAKGVCQACPVMQACRDYAIPLAQLKGVWGGLGEVERRRLRAQGHEEPPAPAAPPRRRRLARPGNGALYRTLAALAASPGHWARVARYGDVYAAAWPHAYEVDGWPLLRGFGHSRRGPSRTAAPCTPATSQWSPRPRSRWPANGERPDR